MSYLYKMGIKSLNKFLQDLCPNVFQRVHLSQFQFKRIAIDTSIYIYKYKICFGDKWLQSFIHLICCLRRNRIHPVFIYDTGCHIEKMAEKKERSNKRSTITSKVEVYKADTDKFIKEGIISPILQQLMDQLAPKRVLKLTHTSNKINLPLIQEAIIKLENQSVQITSEDLKLTREILDMFQIPHYNAILEAETICSDLCKKGLVDSVLSEDTDILVYENPICLAKLDTGTDTCTMVNYNEVLTSLELTSDQFMDFCIMCGTDYNKNIPKIGPKKAYQLIKEYNTIDNMKDVFDISILNHIRTREIFRQYESLSITYIPFCKAINYIELDLFLFRNNIKSSIEYIKKSHENNIKLI